MKTIYALLLVCGIAAAQDINTITQSISGTITATNAACTATSCVWITPPPSLGNVAITLSGTWTATVQFEASPDGVTYNAITSVQSNSSATANGTNNFQLYGLRVLRVRCSAFTSGSITVAMSAGTSVFSGQALLFSPDNTYDIGASGANRPRNLYVGNNAILSGIITTYNGVNTVANGVGAIVAKADATAQAANVGVTTLYTVPVNGAGTYRASCYMVVTQAATSSSTLPNCYVLYNDADSGFAEQVYFTNNPAANTVGTTGVGNGSYGGVMVFQVQASSTIQYRTINYASSGVTPMQYAVHVKLEYLGN
jgi:hypothetical protein